MPRIAVEVERGQVLLSLRDGKKGATLTMPRRAAGALGALLTHATLIDEDSEVSCSLEGSLDTLKKE